MNKRYKQLIVLAAVILMAFVGWFIYREFFTFYLKGTWPDSARVSYAYPYISLDFNKALSKEGYEAILYNSEDKIEYTRQEINDKSLIIYLPGDKSVGDTFRVAVDKLSSSDGRTLSIQLEFTLQDISFDRLSEHDQEEILRIQDIRDEAQPNDPIMNSVPHSELNYNLTIELLPVRGGEESTGGVLLHGEILLSAADVRIDRDGAIEQAKQDIHSYISSLGLDPVSYQIEYSVTEPVL